MIRVDTAQRQLHVSGVTLPCAIGRSGAIAACDKREGDGRTPLGRYPLRHLYVRQDRVGAVETGLPQSVLTPQHGWCDDPAHQLYNQPVPLPFAGGHERLWRTDGLYDLIITLGHNDAPPVPHLGSAIFLHCCAYDNSRAMKPTLGCVAIARDDLLRLCRGFSRETMIDIG